MGFIEILLFSFTIACLIFFEKSIYSKQEKLTDKV